MNKWSDVELVPVKPKPKKKKEIDWLEECEKIKKACEIKTKVPIVLYYPYNKHIISNKTELLNFK